MFSVLPYMTADVPRSFVQPTPSQSKAQQTFRDHEHYVQVSASRTLRSLSVDSVVSCMQLALDTRMNTLLQVTTRQPSPRRCLKLRALSLDYRLSCYLLAPTPSLSFPAVLASCETSSQPGCRHQVYHIYYPVT